MSRPRKNKKFIDPRYFMDEKMEVLSEDKWPSHVPLPTAERAGEMFTSGGPKTWRYDKAREVLKKWSRSPAPGAPWNHAGSGPDGVKWSSWSGATQRQAAAGLENIQQYVDLFRKTTGIPLTIGEYVWEQHGRDCQDGKEDCASVTFTLGLEERAPAAEEKPHATGTAPVQGPSTHKPASDPTGTGFE